MARARAGDVGRQALTGAATKAAGAVGKSLLTGGGLSLAGAGTAALGGLFAAPLAFGLSRILGGGWPRNEPPGPRNPFVWARPDAQGTASWQNDRSRNPVALVPVPGAQQRTRDPKTGKPIPGGAQTLYFLPGVNPAEHGARFGQDWSNIPRTPTQDSTGVRAGRWQPFKTGPPTGNEGEFQEAINQTTVFVPNATGLAEPSPNQMSLNPRFSKGRENMAIRGMTVLPPGYYNGGGGGTNGSGAGAASATGPNRQAGPFRSESQARSWILDNLGWDALQRYVQGQNTPGGVRAEPREILPVAGGPSDSTPGMSGMSTMSPNSPPDNPPPPGTSWVYRDGDWWPSSQPAGGRWNWSERRGWFVDAPIRNVDGRSGEAPQLPPDWWRGQGGNPGTVPSAGGDPNASPRLEPVETRPVAGGPSDRAPYVDMSPSGTLMYHEWNDRAGQWMSRPATAQDRQRVGGGTSPQGADSMYTYANPTAMNRTGWEHYRQRFGRYPGGADMNPPAWRPGEQAGYRPAPGGFSPNASPRREPVETRPGLQFSAENMAAGGGVDQSGGGADNYLNNWWTRLGIPRDVAWTMMGHWRDPATGEWWSSAPRPQAQPAATPAAAATGTGGMTTATTPYRRRPRSRRSTILTGGRGLLNPASIYRPSLLGA